MTTTTMKILRSDNQLYLQNSLNRNKSKNLVLKVLVNFKYLMSVEFITIHVSNF